MNARVRLAIGGPVCVVVAMTLTACRNQNDLNVENSGPSDVTALTGDNELRIPASGAISILDYGCTPGDGTVAFASGQEVPLPGPVCPDRRMEGPPCVPWRT